MESRTEVSVTTFYDPLEFHTIVIDCSAIQFRYSRDPYTEKFAEIMSYWHPGSAGSVQSLCEDSLARESTAKRMKKTFSFIVYMKPWLLQKILRIKERYVPNGPSFPVIEKVDGRRRIHLANRLKFKCVAFYTCGTGNCCTQILTFRLGKFFLWSWWPL